MCRCPIVYFTPLPGRTQKLLQTVDTVEIQTMEMRKNLRPNKAVIALLLALLVPIPGLGQDALSQFMEAARDGHKERVKTFLGAGTEVNAKDTNGFTALEYAAFMGRTETVQTLKSRKTSERVSVFRPAKNLNPAGVATTASVRPAPAKKCRRVMLFFMSSSPLVWIEA